MISLEYKENELHVENISLRDVAARFGTPVYVYSKAKVVERLSFLRNGLAGVEAKICFPVKCNFNLAILDLLCRHGVSFDVASEGELRRVMRIGADPSGIVFTGVGKSSREIEYALDVGIGCFHVESQQELKRIEAAARCRSSKAPIALRVNVNVATSTHEYITTGTCDTKFGIPLEEAEELYAAAHQSQNLSIEGIHCHIGSQITELAPYKEATDKILALVEKLRRRGIHLKFFDIGGGFGIRYRSDDPELRWDDWLRELAEKVTSSGLKLRLEPGRIIMAESGVLLTEVQYVKRMAGKNFAIVDAAMNDFIRPALYAGYHEIMNVKKETGKDFKAYDIVGPLCESSDFFGLNRKLSIAQGDLLVVAATGAYGSAIMSNFSSRARVAEVMIDGDRMHLIKEKETFDQVMSLDHILPAETAKYHKH